MRFPIAAVLVALLAPSASASPFGNSRSDVSDETGSSTVKLSMKKQKKAKPAKKAAKEKQAKADAPKADEEIIIIEGDAPKAVTKPAKKKPAPKKAPPVDEEIVVVADDDAPAKPKKAKPAKPTKAEPEIVIIEDDAPAKPTKAKKAKLAIDDDAQATPKTVALTDDAEDSSADGDEPARLTKAAPAAPRATRFYFRAGAFKSSTRLGEKQFALDTDLPIDTGNLGAGSGVELEQSQIPFGAIVGYVLPVMKRKLSVETVLGFPVKTKFKATGALANQSLAPTFMGMETGIPALGPDLGEASFASPLVTGVYRIADFGRVTPIAGAGVMVLMARGAKVTNPVLNAAGDPKMSIVPSPGLVLQTGAEVRLTKRLTARVDFKYVLGLRVKATVEDIAIAPAALPQLGSIPVGDAVMAAKITPFVVQAGVGTDF